MTRLSMIRNGYTLTSNDMIGKFQLSPDDGECDLCGEPTAIYHIVDINHQESAPTVYRSSHAPHYTERNILDICEHCCLQLASMFKEGTEV